MFIRIQVLKEPDVIEATGKANFVLRLDSEFNSSSGIEVIDGSAIAETFKIRSGNIDVDNVWDFSDIDLIDVDLINGRKGDDQIIGSAIADLLKGASGNDILDGGLGYDTLDGGDHNDVLLGNLGEDTLIGGAGLDTLDGGEGSDIYLARHENIDLYSDTGTEGTDIIAATGNANFVLRLDSEFNSSSGIEVIDGSAIAETFKIRGDNNEVDNVWDFSDIELIDVDLINGRKGDDQIIGSAIADLLKGASGNDVLDGGLGNDTLDGGDHNDLLLGHAGEDTLVGGAGLDTLDGGEDSDVYLAKHENIDLYLDSGTEGTDVIAATGNANFVLRLGSEFNSSSGIEVIDGSEIEQTFKIRGDNNEVNNVWDFSDIDLIDVDLINGRKGDDQIIGSAIADLLKGASGNDVLDGGLGNDTLDGGDHNDLLLGHAGEDTLVGGAGLDTLDGGEGSDVYLAKHENIDLYLDSGTEGTDVIAATGNANFVLRLGSEFNSSSGIEVIDGSEIEQTFKIRGDNNEVNNVWDFSDIDLIDVDLINGRKGDDQIIGSAIADLLKGGSGNDILEGGLGNDSLEGGDNDDILNGGLGEDTLTGGKGADIFEIIDGQGFDVITDFSTTHDNLIFSTTGWIDNVVAVSDEMFVLGTAATTSEQNFIYDQLTGDLFYDSDGNGSNEQIKIASLDSRPNLTHDNLGLSI